MANPSELAKAMFAYARAVRNEHRAEEALIDAQMEHQNARNSRQELWRAVRQLQPPVGVYRVGESGIHDEGILITGTGDYPEVFPMWDANKYTVEG